MTHLTATRALALLLTVTVAHAVPAPAQLRRPVPIEAVRSPVVIEPSKLVLLRERKAVVDIPARIVTLAGPAGWTGPVPDRAAPPSALAIKRFRSASTTPCSTFYDYVDLTGPRANGFRLVGYAVEPLAPPAGYGLQSPAEALAVDTSARDTPTMDLPAAGQIRIRPPLFVKVATFFSTCESRYRLTITLEGPRGRDPFAGVRDPGEGRERERGGRPNR